MTTTSASPHFDSVLGLAPMQGATDLPMRLWLSLVSPPDYAYTPFLRVNREFMPRSIPQRFAPELTSFKNLVPYKLVPQIMTASTDDFVRLACAFLEHCPIVDLNCGCPSPMVRGRGAGSRLLEDPSLFDKFIDSICRQVGSGALSVKMRSGLKDNRKFMGLLQAVCDKPLAQLVLHPRNAEQKYNGRADWSLIAAAQRNAPFPVIGSGDICDKSSFDQRRQESPSTANVMIGRGALRNPWVFAELRSGIAAVITAEALFTALCTYALLYLAAETKFEALIKLANKGLFLNACGAEEDLWRRSFEKLALTILGRPTLPAELNVDRRVLDQVKMLWTYLHSSLPESFHHRSLLRARNFREFQEILESIFKTSGQQKIQFVYSPKLDFLYARY